jgi:hypothetical protein
MEFQSANRTTMSSIVVVIFDLLVATSGVVCGNKDVNVPMVWELSKSSAGVCVCVCLL